MTLARQSLLTLHSAWEHGLSTLCFPAFRVLTLKHVWSSSAGTHSSSAALCKKSKGRRQVWWCHRTYYSIQQKTWKCNYHIYLIIHYLEMFYNKCQKQNNIVVPLDFASRWQGCDSSAEEEKLTFPNWRIPANICNVLQQQREGRKEKTLHINHWKLKSWDNMLSPLTTHETPRPMSYSRFSQTDSVDWLKNFLMVQRLTW